uniref:Putative secreted protein n=1 Tax=Anopheles triannulatus TaxID=58253 RepID=A0A2M4B6S9_9DIPT
MLTAPRRTWNRAEGGPSMCFWFACSLRWLRAGSRSTRRRATCICSCSAIRSCCIRCFSGSMWNTFCGRLSTRSRTVSTVCRFTVAPRKRSRSVPRLIR